MSVRIDADDAVTDTLSKGILKYRVFQAIILINIDFKIIVL